jgi:uncharacterized protein (DUF934 family)
MLTKKSADFPKSQTVVENSLYDKSSPDPSTSAEPLLSLATWIELKQSGQHHGKGIRLAPGEEIDEIIQSLDHISVIALESESYADGRIYSTAIELRLRYGFKKEIRAIGTTPDNFNLLLQCGFDSIELEGNSVKSIRALTSGDQINSLDSIYS